MSLSVLPENTHIIVARYNEDIRWLFEFPEFKGKLWIYNKGDTFDDETWAFIKQFNAKVENLPNLGRDMHTFLYHFIKVYDSSPPPDFIICLQGRIYDTISKEKFIHSLLKYRNDGICNKAIPVINLTENICNFTLPTLNGETLYPAPLSMRDLVYNELKYNLPIITMGFCGLISFNGALIHNKPIDFWYKHMSILEQDNNPEYGHFIERLLVPFLEFTSN